MGSASAAFVLRNVEIDVVERRVACSPSPQQAAIQVLTEQDSEEERPTQFPPSKPARRSERPSPRQDTDQVSVSTTYLHPMIRAHIYRDKTRHRRAMFEHAHTAQDKPRGRPQHRSPNSSVHVEKDGTTCHTVRVYREGWEDTQGMRQPETRRIQPSPGIELQDPPCAATKTSATDSLQELA